MKRLDGCWKHPAEPNRNGSREDHVMANRPLPPQAELRQLLEYDPGTGKLWWRSRPVSSFGSCSRGAVTSANAWNARNAGKEAFTTVSDCGYMRGKVGRVNYVAHRVIWKMVHGTEPQTIDHINGVRSDNRLENLRAATMAENSRNYSKPPGKFSPYRGVAKSKGSASWTAAINCAATSAKRIHLGSFKTAREAALAYDDAAIRLHGEFATLNFPRHAEGASK